MCVLELLCFSLVKEQQKKSNLKSYIVSSYNKQTVDITVDTSYTKGVIFIYFFEQRYISLSLILLYNI